MIGIALALIYLPERSGFHPNMDRRISNISNAKLSYPKAWDVSDIWKMASIASNLCTVDSRNISIASITTLNV